MRKFSFLFIISLIAFSTAAFAQDTLPKISVKNTGNQIIVSWKNNYGAKISNINIQRSKDSLKNFITIGTVLNPLNKENGYVDRKPNGATAFYRVFVAFEGGTYIFSTAHHPVIDTTHEVIAPPVVTEPVAVENTGKEPVVTPPVVVAEEPVAEESIDNFLPKVKLPKVIMVTGFVPSKFIYTNRDNNLVISLPGADQQKFSLKFYDDKGSQVLEIKKITETYLLMEKVNFMHSGWFYYELFNDGVFLERYKFYIGKDGRVGPPPPEPKKPVKPEER